MYGNNLGFIYTVFQIDGIYFFSLYIGSIASKKHSIKKKHNHTDAESSSCTLPLPSGRSWLWYFLRVCRVNSHLKRLWPVHQFANAAPCPTASALMSVRPSARPTARPKEDYFLISCRKNVDKDKDGFSFMPRVQVFWGGAGWVL